MADKEGRTQCLPRVGDAWLVARVDDIHDGVALVEILVPYRAQRPLPTEVPQRDLGLLHLDFANCSPRHRSGGERGPSGGPLSAGERTVQPNRRRYALGRQSFRLRVTADDSTTLPRCRYL